MKGIKFIIILLNIGDCLLYGQYQLQPRVYSIPDENREEIFYDNFSTNRNNWTLVIDDRSFRKLESGSLKCWSFNTNDPKFWKSAFILKKINIDESKDFEIEVSVKCSQYGQSVIPVIWGRNSETLGTLYFGYSSTGQIQILNFKNNNFEYIFNSNKKSEFVKIDDYNKLTVRKCSGIIYFFINEKLVYKIDYFKLPGNEFGIQAPSNSVVYIDYLKLSYIGDVNYEKLVKRIVLNKLEQWESRGKFEKTIDYENRVNQRTKSRMVARLTQEAIDSIGKQKNNLTLLRNEYEADKEAFRLYFCEGDPIYLNVPINEARSFDENFFNLGIRSRFTLENNKFHVVYIDFTNPALEKAYAYRSSKEAYNIKRLFPDIGVIDTVIIPKNVIIQEIAKKEVFFQKQLSDKTKELIEKNEITNNVKTDVSAKVIEVNDSSGETKLDYQITYSYEVIKVLFENQTDDYKPGEFKASGSKAAQLTLELLKKTIENDLAVYLNSGTKVTIKITGSADATPVSRKINYAGEYGIFQGENCFINNRLSKITITEDGGINSNEQLAFLRTYGVRQFIETYCDDLRSTQNVFQHYCEVTKETGSQYRRIAIELIIHDAFKGKQKSDLFHDEINISDVDIEIPETGKYNENYFALIIGNENYSNEIQADFAINDAKVFREYCLKTFGIPENQIQYYENATYGQMQGAIKWVTDIIRAFNSDVNVLLFYSGHGMPDEQNKNPYILPVDGSADIPATALALNDLYVKLQAENPKSVTVFLDACFSGGSRNGMLMSGKGVVISPKQDILKKNFIVFSAASNVEIAYPYKDKYHGMFTYFLLKEIKNSKGNFTYYDMFESLKTNVNRQSVIVNKKSQTPSVQIGLDLSEQWKTMKINQ